MSTFGELAASRRNWIENTLKPWCHDACLQELILAEAEWENVAGRVAPERTLWAWAWGRFPHLVHDELGGIDEASQVRLKLKDGSEVVGFPDSRASLHGQLVLHCAVDASQTKEVGPFSIDEIASVDRD